MSIYIGLKQRVLVFSVKLSNDNPVSTWIGERPTRLGVVDFSRIFSFFFCVCSVFVFDFFFLILLSLSNKSVCICSAVHLFLSYDMSRICLCCKWEDNIKR